MPKQHCKATIISMAIIAGGAAILLHEGLGHGVVAWLRGDIPTEITSNHLSSLRADRVVEAGGTLVNLAVGSLALWGAGIAGSRVNLRYFCWIFAALNLFPGAGYFMYSGISGFGDWEQVIQGLPHQAAWRIAMTAFGAVLYAWVALLLAIQVRPFVAEDRQYNTLGRLPYLVAGSFSCAAGALDPLGLHLFLLSTVAGAFGAPSGLLWLDSLMPRKQPGQALVVQRSLAWWIAATLFAPAFIFILGPGIKLAR